MKRQNSSILFVIQHLHNGGSEATIAKLSIAFSKYFDVHIATFFSAVDYPNSFDYEGELHCLNEAKKTFLPLKIWRRKRFVQNIIEDKEIDIVISFLFNADLINALTSTKNHVSIVGIRTSAKMLIHSKLKRMLYQFIFKKVDIVLVQNKENRNVIKDHFKNSWYEKLRIIPNMFDVEGIIKKSQKGIAYKNKKGTILVTLGRYSDAKGHKHLIKILGSLERNRSKYKLVIIGDGPLKNMYKSMGSAMQLNVVESSEDQIDLSQGDIFLIGFRSNPFKYIAQSDLFVFSSYFEGSPNALAEAMIVGTPVVSTKCPVGPGDLLESKNLQFPEVTELGVLMPVFDSSSLARNELSDAEYKWKEFLENLDGRMDQLKNKARIAQDRMKDYDGEKIIEQWKDVIAQLNSNDN